MAAHKVYTNIFNYSQIPKSINFHYFHVAVFLEKKLQKTHKERYDARNVSHCLHVHDFNIYVV